MPSLGLERQFNMFKIIQSGRSELESQQGMADKAHTYFIVSNVLGSLWGIEAPRVFSERDFSE